MNILVTLNSKYIKPLKVMLKSLFLSNEGEDFCIYLIHSSISETELFDLKEFVAKNGHRLIAIKINEYDFNDAPILMHYTKEMYYRLLAFKYLPEEIDKILYVDPDIIVINRITSLYNTDISNYLFAAAYHDRITVKEVNKLRLYPYAIDEYFNSGVLLMNLNEMRTKVDENEIYSFVDKNRSRLILPDQDIINALYSKNIRKLNEILYNYDPRYFIYYKLTSKDVYDMDYIIENTVIIHFCGKKKPWHKNYIGVFHSLYKHYEKLALGKTNATSGERWNYE